MIKSRVLPWQERWRNQATDGPKEPNEALERDEWPFEATCSILSSMGSFNYMTALE